MTVTGNLKEWTLILYGTSENPYKHYSAQYPCSRMLEIPASEEILEKPELQEETEEQEYNGERIKKKFNIFFSESLKT